MSAPDSPNPPGDAPASAASEVVVLTAKGKRERRSGADIRTHDFRQSGFLGPSELRRIRIRHEQFIRSLAARLAIFLRLEMTVQLNKVQIVGYQKFTENLPNPTNITLFRTDPLKGVGLLVLPPRLSLSLVDRLLGGSGAMPEAGRDLSEIELALSDQIANLLLSEWCSHWPEMRDLKPVLLGHENNSRFLQTAPLDSAMLILTINAGVADQLEPIHIAFPYATIEPLVRLLTPSMPESDRPSVQPAKIGWNRSFDSVKVLASAEWQGLSISASQIANLKSGDVLMLAPDCAASAQLSLSNVPKFHGRLGTRAGKWAVQLTEPISNPAES
jgi:flagellar motor switch protein FliM